MTTCSLIIGYGERRHEIRLPAPSKEEAVKELKSMALTADDGFLADTIDWLFNDVWSEDQK